MGEGAVGRMCQPISPGSPVVTPSILLIDRPFPPLPAGIVAGLAGSAPGVWDDTLHAWALNAIYIYITTKIGLNHCRKFITHEKHRIAKLPTHHIKEMSFGRSYATMFAEYLTQHRSRGGVYVNLEVRLLMCARQRVCVWTLYAFMSFMVLENK